MNFQYFCFINIFTFFGTFICAARCGRQEDFLPGDGDTMLKGMEMILEETQTSSHFVELATDIENDSNEEFGPSCPYGSNDAANLVGAISRTVDFYANNLHLLEPRTDGGFGLAILHGQLEKIMRILETKENIENASNLLNFLSPLFPQSAHLSRSIFDMATSAESNPAYIEGMYVFGNNTDVFNGPKTPWKPASTIKKYNNAFPQIGNEKEVVYPFVDFMCLVSMIKNCSVPYICEVMYLKEAYSQHMLTHQILLLHFAEQKSCMELEKNSEVFADWNSFLEKLCAKAYQEATLIANHNFNARYRDLFAEQVAFCGFSGFTNFFRSDWLNAILSWQSEGSYGCFRDIYGGMPITDIKIDIPTVIKGEQTTETCLIHLTSAALGAMAMNLRYMVDQCSPTIFKSTEKSVLEEDMEKVSGHQQQSMTTPHRLADGKATLINSMCLLMNSNGYYNLQYSGYLLNFSPQCFLTTASSVVDTSNTPPTVDGTFFSTALCVRSSCDLNYHKDEIFLNSYPYYTTGPKRNDIAIFKTKDPVKYNHGCKGEPLEPAWISCDKEGPPANYTDCFLASYGKTNTNQDFLPEFTVPNSIIVKLLSFIHCPPNAAFDPNTELCATGLDGKGPLCQKDLSPYLFCKYWKRDDIGIWGGWDSNDDPSSNSNHGWGWDSPKRQNLLAVGQGLRDKPNNACGAAPGVEILVRYGAPIYRQLFSKCGYYCSNELAEGYRCKGNPPQSLGPVFCFPEKTPNESQNNGWNQ